jgi:hypothetical protein
MPAKPARKPSSDPKATSLFLTKTSESIGLTDLELAEWTPLPSEEATSANKTGPTRLEKDVQLYQSVGGGTDETAVHSELRTSHATGLGVECG